MNNVEIIAFKPFQPFDPATAHAVTHGAEAVFASKKAQAVLMASLPKNLEVAL